MRVEEMAVDHGRRECDYVRRPEVPSGQHLLYQGASTVLHGTLPGANPRIYSMPELERTV